MVKSWFTTSALVVAVALAACGDDSDDDTSSTAAAGTSAYGSPDGSGNSSATPELDEAPVREGGDVDVDGVISREEAEQAALDAVGEGRVTWSAPEDDRGAAWEVEITRLDGSEVDVLVAADGAIVKQVEKFGTAPAMAGAGTAPASGVVSQENAEQAALDAVGEGQVTWVGREDERGAAWEVEITRPDGSEIDVLIAPDGSVID